MVSPATFEQYGVAKQAWTLSKGCSLCGVLRSLNVSSVGGWRSFELGNSHPAPT